MKRFLCICPASPPVWTEKAKKIKKKKKSLRRAACFCPYLHQPWCFCCGLCLKRSTLTTQANLHERPCEWRALNLPWNRCFLQRCICPLVSNGPTWWMCVCVRISLWLKLQRSDEPVPAGGLQSTLCHVRAAGSGLTRCPGSRRLCPAACERRWHKACPAERPVCSLCLPFSSGQYLRLQKEASWHQVDEPLCLSSLSLLPFSLLSRPKKHLESWIAENLCVTQWVGFH